MKQKNLETWWAATGVRKSAHDPATREQCKEIKLSLFLSGWDSFFLVITLTVFQLNHDY